MTLSYSASMLTARCGVPLSARGACPRLPGVDRMAGTEVARFAAAVIRSDTTTGGGGGGRERPAAEYVAARLAEAGIEPVLLESAPGRANVGARVAGRAPGAPALLAHGHLDVVPADPSSWTVPPFAGEIRDGVLWGRCAVDMKNADAALLAVVSQWARSGVRPRRDVVLAFTADEEDTAEFGAQWLVERHAELFEGCTEAVGESGAFTFYAGPGQRLYPIASAERGDGADRHVPLAGAADPDRAGGGGGSWGGSGAFGASGGLCCYGSRGVA